MVAECESTIRLTIPAVRIAVAKLLKKKYKMGQQEIADRMGITQVAVHKYLNGKYSREIGRIVTAVKSHGTDKKIAMVVASGGTISSINRDIDRAAAAYAKAT